MADALLISASDEDLALAVEENLFALFRAMARLPGGEIVESEKLCRHHSFPTSPNFNFRKVDCKISRYLALAEKLIW